ncbi:hypothetical protein [Pseudovibrio sp. SPO723]|uniref:hypothetical protein n=1 Tax=Nesiotobacter zosterae TaxID=392721 RepID=UPI0029C31853|nr:hypothetical protein [Pseudovibrio sp. SPO723]MDX5592289.1 hypothetical protein [Pseudovibrio sp. SPO723]
MEFCRSRVVLDGLPGEAFKSSFVRIIPGRATGSFCGCRGTCRVLPCGKGRDGDEVAEILDELINGDGIKGVKLLGLDEDSFSIQINGWGFDQRSEDRGWNKMVDTILFTNVEDVIDEVLTSPALTSDDGYNIA